MSTPLPPRPFNRSLAAAMAALMLLGLLTFGAVGVTVTRRLLSALSTGPAQVGCDPVEHLDVHYHSHLSLFAAGRPLVVPARIGIPQGGGCIYWLHTHDSSGIIHVELPLRAARHRWLLGDFLTVWGAGGRADLTPPAGGEVRSWLDGRSHPAAPETIPLSDHADIVVEVGPPFRDQPPAYRWPPGF